MTVWPAVDTVVGDADFTTVSAGCARLAGRLTVDGGEVIGPGTPAGGVPVAVAVLEIAGVDVGLGHGVGRGAGDLVAGRERSGAARAGDRRQRPGAGERALVDRRRR